MWFRHRTCREPCMNWCKGDRVEKRVLLCHLPFLCLCTATIECISQTDGKVHAFSYRTLCINSSLFGLIIVLIRLSCSSILRTTMTMTMSSYVQQHCTLRQSAPVWHAYSSHLISSPLHLFIRPSIHRGRWDIYIYAICSRLFCMSSSKQFRPCHVINRIMPPVSPGNILQ